MTVLSELEAALQPNVDPDEAVETIVGLEDRMRGDRAALRRLEEAQDGATLSRWVRIAVLDALANLDSEMKWRPSLEAELADESDADGQARALAGISLDRLEFRGNDPEADNLWFEVGAELEILGAPHADCMSLVIHGTWAADGTWWRSGGDFFEYLRSEVNVTDLYDGDEPFVWSGRNTGRERRRAADALYEWVRQHGPRRSLSVYCHSHGSNVAMLATRHGMQIDRLIMLSTPVRSDYHAKWENVRSAYSVQASRDAVVAMARGRRRFGLPQVKEKVVRATGHASTHSPAVWRQEELPAWVGL